MTSQAQLGITLSGELDRTVAIKLLLAHVADDPDLRQRFQAPRILKQFTFLRSSLYSGAALGVVLNWFEELKQRVPVP